jgi:hypothetical protein
MKSTKGKKKNLTKDHGSGNCILPQGYHGACHLHKEILLFKTIDALIVHMHDKHNYLKTNIN